MKVLFFLFFTLTVYANQSQVLLNWNEANAYCQSKNLTLPNRDTLEKMKEKNILKSSSIVSEFFWSSSVGNGGFSNGAWLIGTGEVIYGYQVKANKHNVVCVKKGDNNE